MSPLEVALVTMSKINILPQNIVKKISLTNLELFHDHKGEQFI